MSSIIIIDANAVDGVIKSTLEDGRLPIVDLVDPGVKVLANHSNSIPWTLHHSPRILLSVQDSGSFKTVDDMLYARHRLLG